MMERKFNDIYSPITAEEIARIPEEMKAVKRCICWGSDKVPVSVVKGTDGIHYGIDVTDPGNWGTFADAAAAIGDECYVKRIDEYFHVVGIGFVVGDGWFCIDMDGGAAHKKETVPETALDDALNTIGTYAEKSPSGCGYHLFGRCDFSTEDAEHNKPHRGQDGKPVPESYEVEFFTRRKFITITGRKVSGSSANVTDCSVAALDFYTRYILNDWKKDETERAAERAKVAAAAPINNDDAAELFRLNYPEILAASDSSNFKRGGPGVKLAPGEYSWIGALKAMQEIGIPESAIIEWCRRGSNFKSEKDVQMVLNKSSKPGAASVAGIIKDAQAHGWKPDPDKLTGDYKRNYEEGQRIRKERADQHRQNVTAALAAVGLDNTPYSETLTVTYNFDDSVCSIIDNKSGEILYKDPTGGADPVQPVPGEIIHTITNTETKSDPAAPWDPIEKAVHLPIFPLEHFPGWIKDYIINFAATNGVHIDYCAASVIASISAAIVGHCDIPFNGPHKEPAQLYSAFVGNSGSKKSSVISQYIGPVRDRLRQLNNNVKKENYAISKQVEELEKGIASEKKKANQDRGKLQKLAADIEQKRQERKNSYPVPLDDVTPEALITSMKYTRGTANIASAEGNIINVLTGHSNTQRGATPNLDTFLKGFDAEPIHAYRVGTGEADIARADISILLAIQPGLLERLLKSTDAVGRGLAQRFIIYAPETVEDDIDYTIPVYMDPEHAERWKKHIEYIIMRFMEPDEPAKLMELEPAADNVIRKFWNYEKELKKERGPGDEDSIIGWISKLHGKALRLSAIMALLRDKTAITITEQDAQNAVDIFKEYYIPQFISVYEIPDNLTKAQRQIVNWIVRRAERTGNHEEFTERELWNDIRQRTAFQGKTGPVRFRAALDNLQEKNYIRPIIESSNATDRKKSKTWQINPETFT